jgi:CheY-like chemotaxis protein
MVVADPDRLSNAGWLATPFASCVARLGDSHYRVWAAPSAAGPSFTWLTALRFGGQEAIENNDVQMPVMHGFKATQEIRSLGEDSSSEPIVAVTNNAFQSEREKYFPSAGTTI